MMLFCEGNVPSSKNGRRWTGRYFLPSKATVDWRKSTKCWWEENAEAFQEMIKDKPLPLKIGMHFVRSSRHKYDWVNPVQTIQDEMVTHGWVEDDNIVYIVPFPFEMDKSYTTYNKENPGVFLKIY